MTYVKNKLSLLACIVIAIVLVQYRLSYSDVQSGKPLKITTWDAFGYYMYLPSAVIYNDMTELKWLPEMDSTYNLTGGELYQANKHTNGNYVNKYFGGVAVLQAPFFFVAHIIALNSHYNADGFSPPYQYAIAFAAIFYCLMGFFILRSVLLRYFKDESVALSLLIMGLATNLIQYAAVDNAMSHAFIFPLYALILHATMKWHGRPSFKWTAIIGLIIGLATICRPTEAIMVFIPLFWGTQDKASRSAKWSLVKANKKYIFVAAGFGLIGVLPQLIYWKVTAGTFVYDVGSKWFFLNPFFRVLFGFENGWFIYTPVTLLFIVGFFFIKEFPFRKSVIIFCLINIWIVISWSDWKYGATYSTRALVQGYPVFALALTALLERLLSNKVKWAFLGLISFLMYLNLFQIWQYNETILHYRDMNRLYYTHIFLDAAPTPLDMSLLDTDEIIDNEGGYKSKLLFETNVSMDVQNEGEYPDILGRSTFEVNRTTWIKVSASLLTQEGFAGSYLNCKIQSGDESKEKVFRLAHAMSNERVVNKYEFFVKVPTHFKNPEVLVFTSSFTGFKGVLKHLKITQLTEVD